MIACAKTAITRLDDNISSAEVIGRAALSQCRKQERAVYVAAIRGMDGYVLQGFNQTYNPERMFTGFVLKERATKRERR
jgi:hypothetical protein